VDRSRQGRSKHEPLRDKLTDLPTRAVLREHLALAVARAEVEDREVALLHVGVDSFNLVNDSLGRDGGDAALREIALRLRDLAGPTRIVARPGADQFCVMLADARGDADRLTEIVAGQIGAALHDPIEVDGVRFELTASTGASVFPHDARDATSLIRHAEAAMHDAKAIGAGTLALYSGDTSDAYQRLVLPLRLRTALERHEFVLEYQPIFSLPERRLVAAEALLRHADPRRGLVSPRDFLPVAEHTGLIEPIGKWVISTVCAQSREWRLSGLALPVTINVSLRQLRDDAFAGLVEREANDHGIEARDLILEITETTAMSDPRCVEPPLRALHESGFRIAIDDFGTGYSSLARLRQMPVDVVKLDRALVTNTPTDNGARRLLNATIRLVDALGMTAVAEGVETHDELAVVSDARCGLVQGFHLGRPQSPADMTDLLRAEHRPATRRRATSSWP
jgi:diguanylate cyclase (GGDEF)-like protein